jgi:hypothetical protein
MAAIGKTSAATDVNQMLFMTTPQTMQNYSVFDLDANATISQLQPGEDAAPPDI